MHEIGRVLGRGDEDAGIMRETLEPGTRVGVAPDLVAGAAGEAVAAVPPPTGARTDDERPSGGNTMPEPTSVAVASAGVAQLIGWVPRRLPLRWENLVGDDDLGDLLGVDVEGVKPR
jgi:hypothetical protein